MHIAVRRGARAAPALLCILLACQVSNAHRAKGSLTTIDYNGHSGRVEIVHRLHRHDAELGVGMVLGAPALALDSLKGRAQVALYVAERFAIASDGEELPLEVVGAELAGDYVLVYQERTGRLPRRIAVRDDILRDAFPTQINQVNISDGDAVHSLVFTGDRHWRDFAFSHAVAETADPRS